MRTMEPVVIVEGQEECAALLQPTRSAPRWTRRSIGVGATVLVHFMLAMPMVLGVAAHRNRTPDGPGSVAWASRGERSESMVLLDLSSTATTDFDAATPQISATGINPEEFRIELASNDPRPPAELKPEEFEAADVATEAAGDPTGTAALFGRYMGQVSARIERAWLRPRTAVSGGHFDCQARITQDRAGNVLDIELQECGADERWRATLLAAIRRASPISSPPEPWLYSATLTLRFSANQYVDGISAEYLYEPVDRRLAMQGAEGAQPAVMSPSAPGDYELTNSDGRLVLKKRSVTKPR